MTEPLTDREKALVEVCRKVFGYNGAGIVWPSDVNIARTMLEVLDALRAYDPPKPKVPVLPEWNELDGNQQLAVKGARNYADIEDMWIAIRNITAKDSE